MKLPNKYITIEPLFFTCSIPISQEKEKLLDSDYASVSDDEPAHSVIPASTDRESNAIN